ncbi:hypothetical protein OP10G_4066 [Fimbriimonas ginsengisoli Gsoil 348]|uniref:Uncharacterized protein n=1 Tax=Fimbriimonas ginsengisoli Gsoil 348 TaxID=661478 RepID=A0A068NYU5_FIMGI|nr:hypothetical protein OP10G_4066 [Fimbriimonas ginsengisoli Gsoil 348]
MVKANHLPHRIGIAVGDSSGKLGIRQVSFPIDPESITLL